MKGFLGYALGVLTVGVFLIAYGVLVPRAATVAAPPPGWTTMDQIGLQGARPVLAGDRIALTDAYAPAAFNGGAAPAYAQYPSSAPRLVRTASTTQGASSRPAAAARVDSGRNWQKIAMVIGGSSAAGAGIGALVGGKKGALIGAAVGAGASSLYEAKH